MSTIPNPILTLLCARNSTVSVPERNLANDLDLWIDKYYPLFRIWLTGTPSTAWTQDNANELKAALLERNGSRVTSVRMLAMLAWANHAFDGWQSFALENSPLAPKRSILVPLSGLSRSQASYIAKSKGLRALVRRLIPPRDEWCPATSSSQSEQKPDPWTSMIRCWDFLVRSTNCTTPAEQTKLAREFDLDPVKAERMIARAKKLQNLKAVRAPKFQMIKRNRVRLHVPPKPRVGQNKTLAPIFASGMADARAEFPKETIKAVADWLHRVPFSGIRLTFKDTREARSAACQRDLLENMGVP